MNKLQREVLIGCCLGDISIQDVSKTTSRFQITHTIKQEEYVRHKYKIFEDLCGTEPRIKDRKYPVMYFNTLSSKKIKKITDMFWSGNVRRVPHNIKELMTERSLAYWFFDDGSCNYVSKTPRLKTRNSIIEMSTDRYTREEVEILIEMLEENFNIKSKIKNSKSMGDRCKIYIGTKQTQKFLDIIEPFTVQSMEYKIKRPYTLD